VSSVVNFILGSTLGPVASHHPASRGWAVVAASLAFFQLAVSFRMLAAARRGRA
jgi:hypothetical protein